MYWRIKKRDISEQNIFLSEIFFPPIFIYLFIFLFFFSFHLLPIFRFAYFFRSSSIEKRMVGKLPRNKFRMGFFFYDAGIAY